MANTPITSAVSASLEGAIVNAINNAVEEIVTDVANNAAGEVYRRVKSRAADISASVLSHYSIQTLGQELVIRVDLRGLEGLKK